MKSIGLILLSIFLVGVMPVHAEMTEGDITVEVEGNGTSKKGALLDAKRNAVEQGIGTILISETEMKNFRIQKDTVLSRAMGSVRQFEVLKEDALQDNTFYVKIRAVVSLSGIKSDLAALKILLEAMDKPRMMVVIKEQNGNAAESAILDYLTKKEFELVDAAVVAALMQEDEALIRRATYSLAKNVCGAPSEHLWTSSTRAWQLISQLAFIAACAQRRVTSMKQRRTKSTRRSVSSNRCAASIAAN